MVTELWKNKLRNMRHGRWQTHGHIVTETDGASAEWFDTTDSHFPILTSSMQAIREDRRQKLYGTKRSQEKRECWCLSGIQEREWVEVITENMFYCLEVHPCVSVLKYHFPSWHGTSFLYKRDQWADLLTWTFQHSNSKSFLLPFLHSREHKLWAWLKIDEINDREMF